MCTAHIDGNHKSNDGGKPFTNDFVSCNNCECFNFDVYFKYTVNINRCFNDNYYDYNNKNNFYKKFEKL